MMRTLLNVSCLLFVGWLAGWFACSFVFHIAFSKNSHRKSSCYLVTRHIRSETISSAPGAPRECSRLDFRCSQKTADWRVPRLVGNFRSLPWGFPEIIRIMSEQIGFPVFCRSCFVVQFQRSRLWWSLAAMWARVLRLGCFSEEGGFESHQSGMGCFDLIGFDTALDWSAAPPSLSQCTCVRAFIVFIFGRSPSSPLWRFVDTVSIFTEINK